MPKLRRALAVASVLAGVAGACASGDDAGEATAPPSTSPAGSTTERTADPTSAAPTTADSAATAPEGTARQPVVVTLAPDSAPEPTSGGTLRFGMQAEVDGLNPTASALTAAPGLAMAAAVFDKLAEFTPDGRAVPYLARAFTPSDDYLTWDVGLRDGVTFHDGTPLDAEAVRYNFAAQYDNPLVGLAMRTLYAGADAAEVIDPLTVRFHLTEPNVYWPSAIASQLGMIASPTWVEAAKLDPMLNQQPVGTGPFRFVSRSEDSITRFERNPDWWNGEVYLDAVEFLPISDASVRGDLLRAGELDVFHAVEPEAILEFRDDPGYTTMLNDASDETYFMTNADKPPFDDLRVRQALAYATPRSTYITLIGQGVVRAADQMFIPESPYFNPDVRQAGDDPDQAVALAAAYCAERGSEINPITGGPTCSDGKINIEYQHTGPSVLQTRIADLVTDAWSVAFNIDRQELLQDEHILQTALGQYNASIWQGFGAVEPMTEGVWLSCRSIGDLSLNFPRLCDPERDQAMLDAQATTDAERRVERYRDVVRRINESATYVFMSHTMWMQVFAEGVHGACERTTPEGEQLACAVNGTVWPATMWVE